MSTLGRCVTAAMLAILLGSLPIASLAANRIVVLEHYTNFR